jgi:hypothetical protein
MKRNTHAMVPGTRFRLLSGADALTEYRFETRTARHLFCKCARAEAGGEGGGGGCTPRAGAGAASAAASRPRGPAAAAWRPCRLAETRP